MTTVAEFRLRRETASPPPAEEESIYVRAKAILDAHEAGTAEPLSDADRKVLMEVVQRARRAARKHPNFEIELSPYMMVLLGLEE